MLLYFSLFMNAIYFLQKSNINIFVHNLIPCLAKYYRETFQKVENLWPLSICCGDFPQNEYDRFKMENKL